jgi:hypothetical protein
MSAALICKDRKPNGDDFSDFVSGANPKAPTLLFDDLSNDPLAQSGAIGSFGRKNGVNRLGIKDGGIPLPEPAIRTEPTTPTGTKTQTKLHRQEKSPCPRGRWSR